MLRSRSPPPWRKQPNGVPLAGASSATGGAGASSASAWVPCPPLAPPPAQLLVGNGLPIGQQLSIPSMVVSPPPLVMQTMEDMFGKLQKVMEPDVQEELHGSTSSSSPDAIVPRQPVDSPCGVSSGLGVDARSDAENSDVQHEPNANTITTRLVESLLELSASQQAKLDAATARIHELEAAKKAQNQERRKHRSIQHKVGQETRRLERRIMDCETDMQAAVERNDQLLLRDLRVRWNTLHDQLAKQGFREL